MTAVFRASGGPVDGRTPGSERKDVRDGLSGVHERDCAPCDAARQAVVALMSSWDPNEAWLAVEALDGPGTLYDEAVRVVATVLHRVPLRRPAMKPTEDHRRAAYSPPSGCHWCGIGQYGHGQRWTEGAAGWHGYTPPTQDQIRTRMLHRRGTR